MGFLNRFWDTAVTIDPKASVLHEGYRSPNATAEALKGLFDNAVAMRQSVSTFERERVRIVCRHVILIIKATSIWPKAITQ
jgi:hypothetical protein